MPTSLGRPSAKVEIFFKCWRGWRFLWLALLTFWPKSLKHSPNLGIKRPSDLQTVGGRVGGWAGPMEANGAKIARSPIGKSAKHSSNVGEVGVFCAHLLAQKCETFVKFGSKATERFSDHLRAPSVECVIVKICLGPWAALASLGRPNIGFRFPA